jgi:tripartite-type tricarboxylate transporter receptor subunit TctC
MLAASDYPKGPITLVIPLAPGDAADTAARAMGQALAQHLKVAIVPSNRPGAGGSIGVQGTINAKNDGYTLLFTQNSPLTIRRVLEPQAANYDPLKDLTPLALTTRTPSIMVVRKEAPFDSFKSLIEHAKRSPGSVRIGTAGAGSAGDISVQIANALSGTDIISVPYKGASPAVSDVLGGQVEGVVLGLGAVSSHMKSGALRGIAISSRFPEFPDVPTLSELGYRQELQGVWFAFFAPAGVAPEVVDTLLPALEKVARDKAIATQLQPLGIVQDWLPGEKLAAQVRQEYETVSELVKKGRTRK